MKITVYNPQKGRLETLDVIYTAENTTWFNDTGKPGSVVMITDYRVGLLIKESGYNYPTWLYDFSRSDIGFSRAKARALLKQFVYEV